MLMWQLHMLLTWPGSINSQVYIIICTRNQQQQFHREYQEYVDNQQQQHRLGLISSVFGAIESTYEHTKEVVTGKSYDAAEKSNETAKSASENMR